MRSHFVLSEVPYYVIKQRCSDSNPPFPRAPQGTRVELLPLQQEVNSSASSAALPLRTHTGWRRRMTATSKLLMEKKYFELPPKLTYLHQLIRPKTNN